MLPTKIPSWPAFITAANPSQDQLLSAGSVYQWPLQAQGQSSGDQVLLTLTVLFFKTSKDEKQIIPFLSKHKVSTVLPSMPRGAILKPGGSLSEL